MHNQTLDERWVPVNPGVYPPGYFPEPIITSTKPTFERFNQMYTKMACISYSTPGYESGFTINQQGTVSFYGNYNYHIVSKAKQKGIKRIEHFNIIPNGIYRVYDLSLTMDVSKNYGKWYTFENDIHDEAIKENSLHVPGIDIIDFIRRTPNLIISNLLPKKPTPEHFLSVIDGRLCLNKGFYYINDEGDLFEPPVIYNPYTFDPKGVEPSLKQIGKITIDENERLSQIKLGWDTNIRLIDGEYTFKGLSFSINKKSNPCIFNKQPLNNIPFIDINMNHQFNDETLNYLTIFHGDHQYVTLNSYPYYPLYYRQNNITVYPYTHIPRHGKISWEYKGVKYNDIHQPNYHGVVDSITVDFNRLAKTDKISYWKPIPDFIKDKYKPVLLDVNDKVYPNIMIPGIYKPYYKRYINVKQHTPIVTPIVGDIVFNYLDDETGVYEWTYEIPFYHWVLSDKNIEISHEINNAQLSKNVVDKVDNLHYNGRIIIPHEYRHSQDIELTSKDIIYPETYYPAQLRADVEYDIDRPYHPVNHVSQLAIYHERYEGLYNPIVLTDDTGIQSSKLIPQKGKELTLAYLYCKINDVWMWVGLESGVTLDIVKVDNTMVYSFNPYTEEGEIKSCIIPLGDMVSERFLYRLSKYTFPLRVYNQHGKMLYHPMGCIPSPLSIDNEGNIDIKMHILDIVNVPCEVIYIGEGSTLKYDIEKGGYILNGTLTLLQQNHYISIHGNDGVIPVFPIDIENIKKYQGITLLDTIGMNRIDLSKPIYDWFDVV